MARVTPTSGYRTDLHTMGALPGRWMLVSCSEMVGLRVPAFWLLATGYGHITPGGWP